MWVAIIDADLIGRKKHRFPNLVCMKLSAYHKNIGDAVELKLDYDNLDNYGKVYIAKVFTDTEVPATVLKMENVKYGGTGFFYDKAESLPPYIEHIFPDYHLYDSWASEQLSRGASKTSVAAYTDYSIGYLTRGCFRRCPFCVNRNYNKVNKHSPLEEFLDPARPKIILLDDNFLGCEKWRELLNTLKESKKCFQFKQGLDERLLTPEICKELFSSKYDGDYIFAFDNVKDAEIIRRKLVMARKFTSRVLKFYCFCGYDWNGKWDNSFWENDIKDLFIRIKILMENKCLPYVMRFSRYSESPYRGMYISLARWCNQPAMFKKLSLIEFAELNGKKSACYKYLMIYLSTHPEMEAYFTMRFQTD